MHSFSHVTCLAVYSLQPIRRYSLQGSSTQQKMEVARTPSFANSASSSTPSPISFTFADDDGGAAGIVRSSSLTRGSSSRHAHQVGQEQQDGKGKHLNLQNQRVPTPPPKSLLMPNMGVGVGTGVGVAGADEMYPHSSSGANANVNSIGNGVKETLLTRLGRATGTTTNTTATNPTASAQPKKTHLAMDDSHPSIIERDLENLIQISDVTSLNTTTQHITSISQTNDENVNSNQKMNPAQQNAMERFLAAQLSGDQIAKESAWRALVSAMKSDQERSTLHLSSSGRSRGSNKSWNSSMSGKDEVLGFIRIGGGLKVNGGDGSGGACDAASITSCLTSPTSSPTRSYLIGTATTNAYQSNGGGSSTSVETPPKKERRPIFQSKMGSNELPTMPALPGSGDLPMVSPLTQVDAGSEEDDFGNLTGETTIPSPKNTENGESGGKKYSVFFDIGEAEGGKVGGDGRDALDSLLLEDLLEPKLNDGTEKRDGTNTNVVKNLIGQCKAAKLSARSNGTSLFQRTGDTELKQQQPPQSQNVRRSRRGSRGNGCSLEEQIRHVVEQQSNEESDNEDDEEEEEEGEHRAITPIPELVPDTTGGLTPAVNTSAKPKKKSGRTKSGTVGSRSSASAQDILRELRRSPTPSSLHSDRSFNSMSRSKPPLSISVGGRKLSPGLKPDVGKSSGTSEGNSPRAPTPPPALAPSRRDLPRPNRIGRRSVSDPISSNASNNESANRIPSPVGTLVRSKTEVAVNEKSFVESSTSPTARPRSRLFPCTSPLTLGSERNTQHATCFADQQIGLNERSADNNPFNEPSSPIPLETSTEEISVSMEPDLHDSPRRLPPSEPKYPGLAPSKRDMPIISFYPRRRALEERVSPTVSDQGSHSSPDLDEIRASISKLKFNGVGGIGKATSTLVRNEETGRYVIRDVDDASFDDIVLAEMLRPKPIEEEGVALVANGNIDEILDENTTEAVGRSSKPADVSASKEMSERAVLSGRMLSDDAVEDALRAATDALSTTTDDVSGEASEQIHLYPPVDVIKRTPPRKKAMKEETNDEDDLFVIRRPSHGNAKWSAFESSDPFKDDEFDIEPSMDLEAWEDDKEDGGDWTGLSPTSVSATNRKVLSREATSNKQERYRKETVQEEWDPFDV